MRSSWQPWRAKSVAASSASGPGSPRMVSMRDGVTVAGPSRQGSATPSVAITRIAPRSSVAARSSIDGRRDGSAWVDASARSGSGGSNNSCHVPSGHTRKAVLSPTRTTRASPDSRNSATTMVVAPPPAAAWLAASTARAGEAVSRNDSVAAWHARAAAPAEPGTEPTPSAIAATKVPPPQTHAKLSSGASADRRCRTPTTDAARNRKRPVLAPSARHPAVPAAPRSRKRGSAVAAGDGRPSTGRP